MTTVRITYRDISTNAYLPVYFNVLDNALAPDWLAELQKLLSSNDFELEKNYMMMGYSCTGRDLEFLCNEMNAAITTINKFNETSTWLNAGIKPYVIEEYTSPDAVMFGSDYALQDVANPNHVLDYKNCLRYNLKTSFTNKIHQHFERLQGTVEHPSRYFELASASVKYAIRQLNILVHEIESLVRALRKKHTRPDELQLSNIVTFPHAPRSKLTAKHAELFNANEYRREFGTIYMHWCQIGKTLFEVWSDENAPPIEIGDDPRSILVYTPGASRTTCEAITALEYYSGEFDIVWGEESKRAFVVEEKAAYRKWLEQAGVPWDPAKYSLGYLPLATCDLIKSFGTDDPMAVQSMLEKHADIYEIAIHYPTNTVSRTFPSSWRDEDWHANLKQQLYGNNND